MTTGKYGIRIKNIEAGTLYAVSYTHLYDRGEGGSPHAHIQDKNKNRIQNDIGNRSQQNGHHSDFAKSLGIDKAVHPKTHHNKKAAEQINRDISVGKRPGGIAGSEQIEHGTFEYQTESGQENA